MIAISGAILFVLLTPGLLLRIPPKGPLLTTAIVHAIVFAVLFYFIGMFIYPYYDKIESFKNHKNHKNHKNNNAKNICRNVKRAGTHLLEFANIMDKNNINVPRKASTNFVKSMGILRDIKNSKLCMK